jgi:hypothetical protein
VPCVAPPETPVPAAASVPHHAVEVVYSEPERPKKKIEPVQYILPKHDPKLWQQPKQRTVVWPDRVDSWVEYPEDAAEDELVADAADEPKYAAPMTETEPEEIVSEAAEPTAAEPEEPEPESEITAEPEEPVDSEKIR